MFVYFHNFLNSQDTFIGTLIVLTMISILVFSYFQFMRD